MNRMLPTIALLLLAGHPEADAALADRAKFPPDQQPGIVYLSLLDCPPEQRDKLESVLKFLVPSLSSETYLADQLPVRVEGTSLLRLDLGGLGWESTYPAVLGQHLVPTYRPDLAHAKAVPLVAPGLWFAASIIDPVETGDSQYQLLYGGKPPANVNELLTFWGISSDPLFAFGTIEGSSGVAVQRTRLIENRPGSKRNVAWLTRDSETVAGAFDPLENLPNKAKFQAQEIIIQSPKWAYGKAGVLQVYFLADGSGKRQEVAPARIVVDHAQTRGVEIRNTVSCLACHSKGINPPTTDAFREYIRAGAQVAFQSKDEQRNTDRYLGSDVAKEVSAGQQAYADGVRLCNGLTPEQTTSAVVEIIKFYDRDVSLEQAARELYCEPKDLQLALADYSRKQTLTGRLALLAQGQAISREQWKANYAFASQVLYSWQKQ